MEHDNHEPRCRILGIKPTFGPCKGMNRIVRHHEMPWPFPNLEHGSKYFISPSIDTAGKNIYVDLGDVKALEKIVCVRYVNGTNKKRIEDQLSQHSFKMIVDGDERRCNLTVMKHPNQFRKEHLCWISTQRKSTENTRQCVDLMCSIAISAISSACGGEAASLEALGGSTFHYKFKHDAPQEHLELFAKHLKVNGPGRFQTKLKIHHFGRHGNGILTVLAESLMNELSACAFLTFLIGK